MTDVFVSYKAEDRAKVRPLVEALAADGYAVWWDAHVGAGEAWRDSIQQHLDEAKCVIVVWSRRSVGPDGSFVRDEATRALRRHVYLPVRIDKVDPPLGFGETQALPLIGWKGDRTDPRYQAALNAVRDIVAGKLLDTRRVAVADIGVSRRALIAAGATASVVAGAGGWFWLNPRGAGASDSIAVLPFANLSGDPNQAYFSEGIAEELRSALARLAGLKVVGRTSSEVVRSDDAKTAARKLGVPKILTGSVRQSPSMIRVNAQLIDGLHGIELWSQSYDRAPGDVIKIQTDIAVKVAQALSVALGRAGTARLVVGGTNSAEAQNLVLRANEITHQVSTEASLNEALGLINRAIAIDPDYADAYARKAVLLHFLENYSSGATELAGLKAETLRFASKAAELSPNLPTAHFALAIYYEGTLNIGQAATEYRRAIRLAPGNAVILAWYAGFVSAIATATEAIRLADKAVALDPLNSETHSTRLATLLVGRRYAEVVRMGKHLQRVSPELFDADFTVGDALLLLGKFEDAAHYYRQGAPDDWARIVRETLLLIRTGDHPGAQLGLARLRELFGDAASYQYAEIYAQLGDKDGAFKALDRAWQIKDGGLVFMKVDPFLDPIRREPRFKAIEAKLNFPRG